MQQKTTVCMTCSQFEMKRTVRKIVELLALNFNKGISREKRTNMK